MTGLSPKSAIGMVQTFVEHEILVEITGYQRNRVYVFDEYVRLFDK